MAVTIKDFAKRYANIRERYPHIGQCNHEGCRNPPDITSMGVDSSCSYHRMLFDHWLYEKMDPVPEMEHTLLRREAFGKWNDGIDDFLRDKIVTHAAQDAINWEC